MDWTGFVHSFYDIFFYLPSWILGQLQTFFANIFTPLSWFLNFLKGFFGGLNSTPTSTTLPWTFDANILAFFNAIPYWNYLMFGLGAGLSILILTFIFRRFADF
jgi:hypothetical protein